MPGPRFPDAWTIREGLFAVVAGDSDDSRTILRLSAYTEKAIPRIADELGLPPGVRVRVYLAHTEEQFQGLQPGAPPKWAEGTAWPASGLVFLKSPRLRAGTAEPLEKVLEHELIHVVLGQAFGPRPVPRWLQEGLAQILAREYSPELTRRIARGTLGNKLLTLDELTAGFPEDPLRAQLAYAQSADLIAFIKNRYGEEALQVLIRELATGSTVPGAFRASTGHFIEDVDLAWRARLKRSDLWISGLVQDNLWWGIGAVLIVVGGLLRMKRKRARLRAWALQEEEAHRIENEQRAPAPAAFQHPVIESAWEARNIDQRQVPGGRWIH